MKHGIFSAADLVAVYAPPNLRSVMPGNRVMLRSGGPEMTVCDTDGEFATCQWMGSDANLQSHQFHLACLTCFGAK